MKEYILSSCLSIFIIFFTQISFMSATTNSNVWERFTYKFQKAINFVIGLIFFVAINILYFVNNKIGTLLFYVVLSQFIVSSIYVIILNVISYFKKKRLVDNYILTIESNTNKKLSSKELLEMIIIRYDKVFTKQDIDKALKRSKKKLM